MKKIIVTILSLGLLAACGRPYVADNTPPLRSQVKAGDVLRLHRELLFLPTVNRLTFQYSEITGSGAMMLGHRKYEEDCSLKLNKTYYKRVTVPQQDFTITRVQPYTDSAILDKVYYGIRLYLKSSKSPEVEMLDCRYPGEVYEEIPFTIRKFESAIGNVVSIKRAP